MKKHLYITRTTKLLVGVLNYLLFIHFFTGLKIDRQLAWNGTPKIAFKIVVVMPNDIRKLKN